MATNLVSQISQFLAAEIASRVASSLGLDKTSTQKAIAAAVPAILGALISLVSKSQGATKLSECRGNARARGALELGECHWPAWPKSSDRQWLQHSELRLSAARHFQASAAPSRNMRGLDRAARIACSAFSRLSY